MNFFRKLLFPFAILYGIVTYFRNLFYDIGWFQSHSFKIPIIAVGNLSVGGTGKSPQIEYLIRLLLQNNYRIATLSRGYKRKSKGFILADKNQNAQTLGDEPFQFHRKFPEISVAVDVNRVEGIQKLMQKSHPQVVLLDDAFQHRKVKAGFYVLLTAFDDLFANDWVLPMGNLREFSSGKNRANLVVVTKCPHDLTDSEKLQIASKLNLKPKQPLFFSKIQYDSFIFSATQQFCVQDFIKKPKLLLAGIAKPDSFFAYLHQPNDICLTFSDHHDFSESDIENILKTASNKPIVTTEKDFVRLVGSIPTDQLFYLPIQSQFLQEGDLFDQIILNYVESNS
jgi:tetraacyldisaccharide 4'-kinase